MPDQPPETEIQIEIPPEVEAGTFADITSVWHTADTFVLDFIATKRAPEGVVDADGKRRVVVAAKVVARVRIPPQQVFEIARVLTQQLDQWEKEKGQMPPTGLGG